MSDTSDKIRTEDHHHPSSAALREIRDIDLNAVEVITRSCGIAIVSQLGRKLCAGF